MTGNFQVETGRDLGGSLRQPAIGLDATDRAADIVTYVQAANRAQQHDAHVLVATEASDVQLRTELRSPNVTLVEVSETAGTDAEQALCAAGKELGFPGVVLQPSPAADVDYSASREAFMRTDKYAIQAPVSGTDIDADLIAGIPAGAASADVVRQVREHVDTVLVVGDTESATQPLITEQDGVSVIESDAGSDTAAIRALFEHVERTYTDYDAVVLLAEPSAYHPGWIPDLTDALATEDADLVVGQTRDADDPAAGSVYRRFKDHLQDSFTLGAAETAGASLQPGLQALSPTAVSHLEVPADASEIGSHLLEAAISTDLTVSVTDVTTDTDTDSDADAVGESDTGLQLDPEQSPTLEPDAAAPQSAPRTADAGITQRAGLDESDEPDDAVKTPDGYLVGAESAVTPVLSVVIPTMNEEEGIGTCLDWVTEAVAELRIPTEIIVSDSSTDRTPEIARERGAIVVEPDAPGYGYAYRYAFERARGDYIVMGDADTTYDFSEIPRLLDHLQETGADIVMGSRLKGEIKPGSMPALHKYVGNPLLTRFLNTFYDAGVSDAHSGFRILTQEALETLELETTGMEFASEMIMDAGAKDLDIVEVPIVYHEREGEETLDSFRDGWRHVRFMLTNAPSYLFLAPGLLFSVVGAAIMLFAATSVSMDGVNFGLHSMIAGSLGVIVGYQVMTLGALTVAAGDPIQRPNDAVTRVVHDHATLERGATAGCLVFGAGALYAGVLLYRWLTSGLGSLSFTLASLIAFTAIVVGLQTIFSSFCLSAVGE